MWFGQLVQQVQYWYGGMQVDVGLLLLVLWLLEWVQYQCVYQFGDVDVQCYCGVGGRCGQVVLVVMQLCQVYCCYFDVVEDGEVVQQLQGGLVIFGFGINGLQQQVVLQGQCCDGDQIGECGLGVCGFGWGGNGE